MKDKYNPLVSVVIPTYNRRGMVQDAIDSVFSQTYRPLELIVVDSGSNDGTKEAVLGLDKGVIYLESKTKGPSSARNMGISSATGDYIAFLDDDDLWHPEKIEIQIEFLKRHPDVAMVSSDTVSQDEDITPKNEPWIFGDLYPRLFMESFVSTPTVVVRRDVVEEVGGFNEKYIRAEDYDLWLKIAKVFPIAHLKAPLVLVRKSPNRLSGDKIDLRITAKKILEGHYDPERISERKFKKRMSDLNIYLGREYMKAGEREKGVECFRSAIKLTPLRLRALRYRLRALFR